MDYQVVEKIEKVNGVITVRVKFVETVDIQRITRDPAVFNRICEELKNRLRIPESRQSLLGECEKQSRVIGISFV